MANIAFGSKYLIFSKFSSIPKTSKIEQDRANLQKEYDDFMAFGESSELNDFKELGVYLESKEYIHAVNKLQDQKKAEEGRINNYASQVKSKKFKNHFKFKSSAKLKEHLTFADSKDYQRYIELKNSKALKSDENLQKELSNLEKSGGIKRFLKFENNPKYKEYKAFEDSKELADHFKLGEYLKSPEHTELLKESNDKLLAENDKKKKFEEFKNSKKYKWFTELQNSNKFDQLKSWEVVFEDDFNGKLDQEKWLTRYFWGDKLFNGPYALEHDKAFPTDGKNLETGNTLKIVTKREKVEGTIWKLPFGFVPQTFDYSTGMINSGKSHRQLYGKVEAKIKINYAKAVNYNFWMASDKMLPHIDILKLQQKKSKAELSHHYGNAKDAQHTKAEFSGLDLDQDFFIYTLEWTKDKLTWKINDVVVNEQTKGVPQEPLFITFSCGITGKPNDAGLPASMEIDWVRCYKKV